MKKIAALIVVCLLAATARAIELSLEENRGDRGSVGFVDIQRLFADSPDAQKAKESFEDLVHQAEERVNLRKAELLKLHRDLDKTRAERDALAMVMSTIPAESTAAAPSTPPLPAAAAPALSTAPAPGAAPKAAPALVAVSTSAAANIRELSLPGMSSASAAPTAPPVAPIAVSSSAASAVARSSATAASVAASSSAVAAVAVSSPAVAAVAVSSPTASHGPLPVFTSTGIAAAAAMFPAAPAPVVVQAPAGPTPVQRLLEFDGKIIKLQGDISEKEAALTHEHDSADRGLLDVESRKTDQVLAKIYRAVSEVAHREGVSVVIDKASILYGQNAVDLTDKVLKYLKETPPQ
jgi:Skp family chaperone for outer membrane proteins